MQQVKILMQFYMIPYANGNVNAFPRFFIENFSDSCMV